MHSRYLTPCPPIPAAYQLLKSQVGRLKIKPLIYLVISLLLVIPGVFLTIEGPG